MACVNSTMIPRAECGSLHREITLSVICTWQSKGQEVLYLGAVPSKKTLSLLSSAARNLLLQTQGRLLAPEANH